MKLLRILSLSLIAGAAPALLAAPAKQITIEGLIETSTDAKLAAARQENPALLDQQLLRLDLADWSADTAGIRFRTPTGEEIDLNREVASKGVDGSVFWEGSTLAKVGPDAGAGSFVYADGMVAGRFSQGHTEWRLTPQGNGLHLLQAVDQRLLQSPGHGDVFDRPAAQLAESAESQKRFASEVRASQVDIMIAVDSRYIPSLRAASLQAQLEVSLTNQAFRNSAIPLNLRLVGTHVVTDTPGDLAVNQLAALVSTNDNVMDAVHPLRDRWGADIVVLMSQRQGAVCGIARSLFPNASEAFAVVGALSQCDSTLFSHEVAHLFSADHDPANACDNPNLPSPCLPPSSGSFKAYAHGYTRNYTGQMAVESYATIMTYLPGSSCPSGLCTRLEQFSNPRLQDSFGNPTGSAYQYDNARAIGEEAARIAAFRVPQAQYVGSPGSGSWYNPARSGHGLNFSYTAYGNVMYWYTYDSSGQPIWYVTDPVQPSGGVWRSSLYRANYLGLGAGANLTTVGDVEFRMLSSSSGLFSWDLYSDGNQSDYDGAEYMSFLFGGGSYTGAWYDPADSGWGLSIDNLGLNTAVTAYYYLANGQPTWAQSNGAVWGNPTQQQTYSMVRYYGPALCPTCQGQGYAAPVGSWAGNIGLRLTGSGGTGWVDLRAPDGSIFRRGTSVSPRNLYRLSY